MRHDTPCKNCNFAKYEENTQVGCHLNMIEKFTDNGVDVIEAYDEDKEFYVIKNRSCHFFRPEKWGINRSLEEKIDAVRLETKVPFNAIVFVDSDYAGLKRTLGSLYRQKYKMSHIMVVRTVNSTIWPSDITDLLNSRSVRWRLENQRRPMSNWKAFHLIQKLCSYPYHAVFQSGYKVPKDMFEKINNAIIDDLKTFAMIEDEISDTDKIGSGLIIPSAVYNHFYFKGDPQINFVKNVRESECQTQKKLSYTIQSLCQTS